MAYLGTATHIAFYQRHCASNIVGWEWGHWPSPEHEICGLTWNHDKNETCVSVRFYVAAIQLFWTFSEGFRGLIFAKDFLLFSTVFDVLKNCRCATFSKTCHQSEIEDLNSQLFMTWAETKNYEMMRVLLTVKICKRACAQSSSGVRTVVVFETRPKNAIDAQTTIGGEHAYWRSG